MIIATAFCVQTSRRSASSGIDKRHRLGYGLDAATIRKRSSLCGSVADDRSIRLAGPCCFFGNRNDAFAAAPNSGAQTEPFFRGKLRLPMRCDEPVAAEIAAAIDAQRADIRQAEFHLLSLSYVSVAADIFYPNSDAIALHSPPDLAFGSGNSSLIQ